MQLNILVLSRRALLANPTTPVYSSLHLGDIRGTSNRIVSGL